MKTSYLAFVVLLFMTSAAQAQQGAELARQAGNALARYHMDPSANAIGLFEAKQAIDQSLQSADAQAVASAWMTRGDVYNAMLQRDMAKRLSPGNEQSPLTGNNDALIACLGIVRGGGKNAVSFLKQ